MTGTAREAAPELWDIYHLPVVPIPDEPALPARSTCPTLAVRGRGRTSGRRSSRRSVSVHGAGPTGSGRHPQRQGQRAPAVAAGRDRRLDSPRAQRGAHMPRRRPSSPWPASRARSPSPRTWPAAAPTSGSAPGWPGCGGLHVIATECHESQRIDRQLFGRCARQGDPGSARLYVSMEDEIIRRYVPEALRGGLIGGQLAARVPGPGTRRLRRVRAAQGATERLAFRSAALGAAHGHMARRLAVLCPRRVVRLGSRGGGGAHRAAEISFLTNRRL